MFFIVIGNVLSALAACATLASGWVNEKSKSFFFQFLECSILALANVFFHSWSGITTLVLCAVRNYIIYKGKYTRNVCILFMVLIGGAGVYVNNRGLIGLLIVFATVFYCAGCYLTENPMPVKINILINHICWIIYDAFVWDFVSVITETLALIAIITSMIRLGRTAASLPEAETADALGRSGSV